MPESRKARNTQIPQNAPEKKKKKRSKRQQIYQVRFQTICLGADARKRVDGARLP